MTAFAYYNEYDEEAAGALAELMHRGLIAPGYIDTRSIKDVHPDDLEGFRQVHLCIGSAFMHKPPHFPQCFPDGADGDACCTRVLLRKTQ